MMMLTMTLVNNDNNNNTGLEIANNTVAFVTEIFPFATKIPGEVTNLRLVFTFTLSKQMS